MPFLPDLSTSPSDAGAESDTIGFVSRSEMGGTMLTFEAQTDLMNTLNFQQVDEQLQRTLQVLTAYDRTISGLVASTVPAADISSERLSMLSEAPSQLPLDAALVSAQGAKWNVPGYIETQG